MKTLPETQSVKAFSALSQVAKPVVEQPRSATRAVSQLPTATQHLSNLARLVSTRVAPYIAYQVQRGGRAGVMGIALIIFSLVCFVSANSPLRNQLADLQTEISTAHASQVVADTVVREVPSKTLISNLPSRAELPAVTEQIVARADAAGLALEQGSYEVKVVGSGEIARASLTFPVHGGYPNIRRFIDETLAVIPGAALDGLQLQRKEIGAAEIDAEIRFAVYLRNAA